MDSDEKLYELLLTEKALADAQISQAMESNLKVLGFFGAAAVLLGWLYSDKGLALQASHSALVGIICDAVVIVGCCIILQGIATYGVVLGYIQYKNRALNQAFVAVAGITTQYPFRAVEQWWTSEARKPVLLATGMLFVCHAGLSAGLLIISWDSFAQHAIYRLVTWAATAVLSVTLYAELSLGQAIKRVFTAQLPPLASPPAEITKPSAG